MAVDVGLLVLVVAGAGTALGIRTRGVSIPGSPPVCKHANVNKAENKEEYISFSFMAQTYRYRTQHHRISGTNNIEL